MPDLKLNLHLLDGLFAVCKFPLEAGVTEPVDGGDFFSVTRTREELSVICSEDSVPAAARCERGWRCFKVDGPLDFYAIGIIASISKALADAGISLFTVSTFDTDYFLIKEGNLEKAVRALTNSGHNVSQH